MGAAHTHHSNRERMVLSMSNLKTIWERNHRALLQRAKPPIRSQAVSLMTAEGEELDELGKLLGHIRQYQPNKYRSGYNSQPDEHYRKYLIEQVGLKLNELTNDWVGRSEYAVSILEKLARACGTQREVITYIGKDGPKNEWDEWESDGDLHNRLCGIVLEWVTGKSVSHGTPL